MIYLTSTYTEQFSYQYTGIGTQTLAPKTIKYTFVYTIILYYMLCFFLLKLSKV